jgi:hypothetical protein
MVEAQQIKEHMEVCGSDGAHIGTVDCTKDLNKIVLTKSDPNPAGSIILFRSIGSRRSTTKCV